MTKKTKLLLVCILLSIVAICMLYIGFVFKNPAPALTGVGFLLIVWALFEKK